MPREHGRTVEVRISSLLWMPAYEAEEKYIYLKTHRDHDYKITKSRLKQAQAVASLCACAAQAYREQIELKER